MQFVYNFEYKLFGVEVPKCLSHTNINGIKGHACIIFALNFFRNKVAQFVPLVSDLVHEFVRGSLHTIQEALLLQFINALL